MNAKTLPLIAAALLAPASAALAHHSFAMFDAKKEVVISGVVTEFQWTNPHTWVEVDVADAKGVVSHWSIEGGSVVGLARQGWTRNIIKPGDKVAVLIHPLRSGEPGGSLMGVVLNDGRRLGEPFTPTGK